MRGSRGLFGNPLDSPGETAFGVAAPWCIKPSLVDWMGRLTGKKENVGTNLGDCDRTWLINQRELVCDEQGNLELGRSLLQSNVIMAH